MGLNKGKRGICGVNGVFFVLVTIATCFGIAGIMTPPEGQVHPTVLILVGQFLLLAASMVLPFIDVDIDISKGVFKLDTDGEEEKKDGVEGQHK